MDGANVEIRCISTTAAVIGLMLDLLDKYSGGMDGVNVNGGTGRVNVGLIGINTVTARMGLMLGLLFIIAVAVVIRSMLGSLYSVL